ncbi:OpgC domain-containing protein [Halothiobacillus diazotrophicus]|nr:OpgC domain-containing protein [Halothiobacillus diazotrophicus]
MMITDGIRPASPSKRLVFLDVLRGFMLVGITLGHFGDTFVWLVWQPLGYFSNAEGFILLSGTVFGLVYARIYHRSPHEMTEKAVRRAGLIYLNHLGLLVFVAAFTWLTYGWSTQWHSHALYLDLAPVKGFLLGILMLYQPPLLDILPMYALFVLVGPLIIRQLMAGRWRVVLAVSFVVWVIFAHLLLGGTWRETLAQRVGLGFPYQTGEFDPLVWQLLFFSGLILGHRMFAHPGALRPKPVLVVLSLMLALYFFALRHDYLPFPGFWHASWVDRHDLGLIRMLNIAALVYLFWTLVVVSRNVVWSRGMIMVRDFFAVLGRHSLPVFTAHVVLIYLTIPVQQAGSDPIRYAVGISLIVFLYLMARVFDGRAARLRREKAGLSRPLGH